MSDEQPLLRQVSIPPARAKQMGAKPIGIVAEAPQARAPAAGLAPAEFDIKFPPINVTPPVSVEYDGGRVGNVETVQLIFWGSAWNLSTVNPSANTIGVAVQTILQGPYMSGLRQYGIKRCAFGEAVVVTDPSVRAIFDDSDIQDLVIRLIEDNLFRKQFDSPDLFFVFMPPGTFYRPGGARGAHSVAAAGDVGSAWVAWIGTNTALSQITSTFCHELTEMCSDPEGDGWTVVGLSSPQNEIGDICNLLDAPLAAVTVESYWSPFDNACLIPTGWSVRRTLAGAGKKLDGRGLRSVQDPIPSLNQLVVNL
jgi:hypothetical protein